MTWTALILPSFTLIFAFLGLFCMPLWLQDWSRNRTRPIKAVHLDEDLDELLGAEERDLILEFHEAGIILPEEKVVYRLKLDGRIFVGPVIPGSHAVSLANQPRHQGYLADLALGERNYQLQQALMQGSPNQQRQTNMAQERALQTLAQTNQDPHRANALAQLIGGPTLGGIGSILGAFGGAFGQGLVRGRPVRWGDKPGE